MIILARHFRIYHTRSSSRDIRIYGVGPELRGWGSTSLNQSVLNTDPRLRDPINNAQRLLSA